MTTTIADTLDTIRRATEARDADALIALYADRATLTIVDRSRPPSRPEVLTGRAAIADYVRETTAREMTHEVADEVGGPERLSFTVRCRYPDGTRVFCATTADLDASAHITRQTIVQAWDD